MKKSENRWNHLKTLVEDNQIILFIDEKEKTATGFDEYGVVASITPKDLADAQYIVVTVPEDLLKKELFAIGDLDDIRDTLGNWQSPAGGNIMVFDLKTGDEVDWEAEVKIKFPELDKDTPDIEEEVEEAPVGKRAKAPVVEDIWTDDVDDEAQDLDDDDDLDADDDDDDLGQVFEEVEEEELT